PVAAGGPSSLRRRALLPRKRRFRWRQFPFHPGPRFLYGLAIVPSTGVLLRAMQLRPAFVPDAACFAGSILSFAGPILIGGDFMLHGRALVAGIAHQPV